MKSLLLPIALLMLVGANAAQATLIEHDFVSSGDKSITYDSVTDLEWLDLKVTQGKFSYDSIQSELLPSHEFYGFRYATKGEVDSLLSSFGLGLHPITQIGNDRAQIEHYFSLLGITQTDYSNIGVQNYWSFGLFNEAGPNDFGSTHYYSSILENFAFGYTAVAYYPSLDYQIDRSLGHYLVRVASVPEPLSAPLVILGLVAFLTCLRKRGIYQTNLILHSTGLPKAVS